MEGAWQWQSEPGMVCMVAGNGMVIRARLDDKWWKNEPVGEAGDLNGWLRDDHSTDCEEGFPD